MRFSYSNISTFAQCPRRWKYQYVDKLKTLPDQTPNNALYLGNAIHKAFETGSMEEGIAEYRSNFYVTNDLIENEVIKLEYFIPKVLEMLPEAECEVKIETDDFVGYIDRLEYLFTDEQGIRHYAIWDYKYANPKNFPNYLTSPQLPIYKWYFEKTHENCVVDDLKYVLIPKVNIRQGKKETLYEFRQRLQAALEESEIKLISVSYDSESVTHFINCCQQLSTVKKFPTNPTKLCDYCPYQQYCESDQKIDWMIL